MLVIMAVILKPQILTVSPAGWSWTVYATLFCSPTCCADDGPWSSKTLCCLFCSHALGMVCPLDEYFATKFPKCRLQQRWSVNGIWVIRLNSTPLMPRIWPFLWHMHTQVSYFDHQVANGHDFQENGKPVDQWWICDDVHGEQAARFISDLRDKSNRSCFISRFRLIPYGSAGGIKRQISFPSGFTGSTRKTYGNVDLMDQAIGKVLTALMKRALGQYTVFFFSDNGGRKTMARIMGLSRW